MDQTPIDVHVGQRLRLARNLAGLNQTTMADAVGVSFQAIQKYEEGDNRISASRLFAAARILGCSVAFFFEGADDHSAESVTPERFLSKELELVRAFRHITNAEARECIRRLVSEISRAHGDKPQSNVLRSAG